MERQRVEHLEHMRPAVEDCGFAFRYQIWSELSTVCSCAPQSTCRPWRFNSGSAITSCIIAIPIINDLIGILLIQTWSDILHVSVVRLCAVDNETPSVEERGCSKMDNF